MCLTDGGETRCHVAFRDLVALKLPVFLLSSLSASIFPPTATLAALYRGLDSHRSAKGECPQMQTTSFVTAIYSPLFSCFDGDYIFKRYPVKRSRSEQEGTNHFNKNEIPFPFPPIPETKCSLYIDKFRRTFEGSTENLKD